MPERKRASPVATAAVIREFGLKDLLIIAITAIFSIMVTVTVTFLTQPNYLTQPEVAAMLRGMLRRAEIVELMHDKSPYTDDREQMQQRITSLERQVLRMETKVNILFDQAGFNKQRMLPRAVPAHPPTYPSEEH